MQRLELMNVRFHTVSTFIFYLREILFEREYACVTGVGERGGGRAGGRGRGREGIPKQVPMLKVEPNAKLKLMILT